MKRTRYSEEQIIGILLVHGRRIGRRCEVRRLVLQARVVGRPFFAWNANYSRMTVYEVKRLKALEGENSELKPLLIGPLLDRLTDHVSILQSNGESYRRANCLAHRRG